MTPTCGNFIIGSRRQLSRGLLALIALCLSASCRSYDEKKARAEIIAIQMTRKEHSLQRIAVPKIKNLPAVEYAARHTTPLIAGVPDLHMEVEKLESQDKESPGFNLTFRARGEKPFNIAAAVSITSDGYFLTAAHCVDEPPIYIVVYNDKQPRLARARVIWPQQGEVKGNRPDLALIYAATHQQSMPFDQMSDEDLKKGKLVLSSGYGGIELNQAAGFIRRVGRMKQAESGARWREIYHTAPLIYGDSGGLLMNEHGRLLGINYEGPMLFYRILGMHFLINRYNKAALPDVDWIMALIKEDRKTLNTSRLSN